MWANTTLENLLDGMYNRMNETTSNRTYSTNDRDIKKLNSVIRRVCSWFLRSSLNPETVYKCKDLDFLRKKQYIQYKEPVACTVAVAVAATSITLPTTNLTTTWAIYTQWVVISYTWKNATQITWCTGVVAAFESGTYFEQVVAVAADFDKWYRVFRMYDGTEKEIYEVKSQDDRYEREMNRAFTVLYDETSGNRFIRFYWYDNEDRFLIKYYAKVDDLVATIDICVIPDERCTDVVCPIAAGELLMESQSEDAEYINKLTLWYASLEEMYSYYTVKFKDMDKIARAAPYNWSSIGGWVSISSRYSNKWFRVY